MIYDEMRYDMIRYLSYTEIIWKELKIRSRRSCIPILRIFKIYQDNVM